MRFLIFLSFIFVFSTTNISASSMSSAQSRQRILQEFRQKLLEEEELQREYDYYMAEKIAKKMRDSGIISIKEYTKLREENRRFFSPFLAEIS